VGCVRILFSSFFLARKCTRTLACLLSCLVAAFPHLIYKGHGNRCCHQGDALHAQVAYRRSRSRASKFILVLRRLLPIGAPRARKVCVLHCVRCMHGYTRTHTHVSTLTVTCTRLRRFDGSCQQILIMHVCLPPFLCRCLCPCSRNVSDFVGV
jgi:hypothetical protein